MKIKKTDSIFSDGSWINHREYAKTDKIKEMWMNIQNSELFDQLLNDNRIDFKDIIKDDYKLIYKCIVVDKILNRKIDKFNNI